MAATTTDKTGSGTEDKTVPVFDPAAFKTELTSEFTKTLNGVKKDMVKDIVKQLKEMTTAKAGEGAGEGEGAGDGTGAGAGAGAGEGAGEGQAKPGSAAVADQNAELKSLRKQLANVTASQKAAEQREAEKDAKLKEQARVSAIHEAMSDIQFRDDAAKKVFFRSVAPDIKYNDDGELIADTSEGPLSIASYIKEMASTVEGLLKPNGTGGAGARGGKPGATGGPTEVQIEDLTAEKISKMKPEELAAVFSTVSSAARDAFAGKT